jgi:hypothetical protein
MATAAINPNQPQGLVPWTRLDGAVASFRTRVYFVPAANTNALFVGDPVVKITGSADANGTMGIDLAAAGTTNKVTGAIVGFKGACAAGAGSALATLFGLPTGNVSRPATTTQDWYVLVNDDPEAQWMIQADANSGSSAGTAMPVTVVGKNANLKSGTGSTATGLSGWQLDSSAPATTVGFQLNIVDIFTDPVNAAVAQFQKVIVRLNTSTETNLQVGI